MDFQKRKNRFSWAGAVPRTPGFIASVPIPETRKSGAGFAHLGLASGGRPGCSRRALSSAQSKEV